MNMQRSRKVGLALFALAVLALAPAAFARTHVSIGLGFYGPGYSVGVSSCHHCGWGHGYRTGFYGSWYAPAYYAPAPVYYAPSRVVYYDEPVVVERVYETHRVYRYDDDRYDDRYDRHYRRDGHRGHYYDDDDGD